MTSNTAKDIPISIDLIRSTYKYNEGNLYKNGAKIGWLDKTTGYFRYKIHGKSYLLHRLIYYFHYGDVPPYLDHINGDKKDNRIENLRPCPTKGHNTINSKARSDNTSGYKGVTWHKSFNKWHSSVYKAGKRYYLGLFDCPKEAALVYNIKARELFGDFTYFNKVFDDV